MEAAVSPRRRDESAVRVRAGWLAFVLGGLIFAGKFAAYAMTGSSAVLSDAMESVVNVVAALLLLYSMLLASRPPDRNHPYGHGKVEFFSAGVEGTLIAMAAVLILVEATRDLVKGPELRNLGGGLLMVSALAIANGLLGRYLIRVGRRTGSVALEADGRHLMTDVATSFGVVAGLSAVRVTGWVVLDPLMAIAVALNILRTGWALVRRAVGGLMDEADVALLERMVGALERDRDPWYIDVHSMRSWRSGVIQHVDLHMSVPRYFDADRLHQIDDRVREILLSGADAVGDVLIHFDPCRPRQCPACTVADCPVRSTAFLGREPLTAQWATRGEEALETGLPLEENRT